jgi:SAM-dependent methyltransferase
MPKATTKKTPKTKRAATKLACPVCRSSNTRIIRRGVREDLVRPVFACAHCRLQFIEPPYKDLRSYYQEQYRLEHDNALGKALTSEERYALMRPLQADSARRFKDLVPPGASVLEIGCSAGFFLDAIGDGYDKFGCEWNTEDAAFVRDVGEIPCEEGQITDIYPGQQFTAIAACQVLEHQTDPIQFLRDCKERLIGGGYLYLEIPNALDAMVSVYGVEEYRDFWYREPHITYWQKETLASVLGALGFEAKVGVMQRYGILNHVNWLLNRVPMEDVHLARLYLSPVDQKHPVAGYLNRQLSRIDKEYRTTLEAIGAADTLVASGARREI